MFHFLETQRNTRVTICHNPECLVDEWWQLFWSCPDATPFQSPAWLLPWWNSFGVGDPLIVLAHQQQQLCGMGLFYIYNGDPARGAQLFFVGQGVSDYQDLLVSAGQRRSEVAQQIFATALDVSGECRIADLQRLPENSPLLGIEAPDGLERFKEGVCPQLRLRGRTREEFVPRRRTRANLRTRFRRAQKQGKVEFLTACAENYSELMADLFRLHSQRWNSSGRHGLLSDPALRIFLNNVAPNLLNAGMLRLHAMKLNGATIAASFGMLHGQRAYLYNFGFDPAHSAIAPATQLIAFAMEQAAQQGAHVYDFLQGDEPYKYETWGAQPHFTYRMRYSPEVHDSAMAADTICEAR